MKFLILLSKDSSLSPLISTVKLLHNRASLCLCRRYLEIEIDAGIQFLLMKNSGKKTTSKVS